MFSLNNKIQIFNNCKMVSQLKERLSHSVLYNFAKWITQGPKAYQSVAHSLDVGMIHASVKQLGKPVSINMILKYC